METRESIQQLYDYGDKLIRSEGPLTNLAAGAAAKQEARFRLALEEVEHQAQQAEALQMMVRQLERIADMLEATTTGGRSINVDIGV